MREALRRWLDKAGGSRTVARQLGISRQAVEQWVSVPPTRVLDVERITGIPRHQLRPDIYPREPEHAR
ncbi:transcriptional regulator [Methylobacterium sp. J-070]|uniref:transcriptional regulator n=1 Tax=Methylobacterium sp. J-070 TaxID=2836650 RepID=UPI001FBA1280|nr:Cro/CI family transcriptional regulator [Methylobacterium sp. J-070]MCJ2051198.1 helix-turn-helix domain-containing protein [Methylobacterium sp. J-070]